MSSIINKVKDAVKGDKHHEQPEGTHGTHNSKVANAADPRIDSDRDHRANPAGTTTGTGVGHSAGGVGHSTTTGTGVGHSAGGVGHSTHTGTGVGHTTGGAYNEGPHSSSTANKVDPRIDSDRSGVHAGNTAGQGYAGSGPEGAHGPHSSRIGNAADPRVDSDRDASRTVGNTYGSSGTAGTHGSSGLTGSHGNTGLTGSNTHGTGLTGSTHNTGMTGSHGTSGMTSSHGTSGMTGTHGTSGMTGTHGTSGMTGTHGTSGVTGGNTHSSGMTGVGSGVTGATGAHAVGHNQSGMTGAGSAMTGAQGHSAYNTGEGTHGTHNSKVANAADPRIDSDRDHRAAPGGHGTSHVGSGPGPAANTAGPHKNDTLNKVDPRVDSDLDGSKTIGGNKTYQSTGHKDPHDAAQVPPSVMQKHVGGPVMEHDDHSHDRERRHSTQTHQEKHSGI
ncbi:Collagen alpha-5(VI) chain [Apiospora arundinis]